MNLKNQSRIFWLNVGCLVANLPFVLLGHVFNLIVLCLNALAITIAYKKDNK